MVEKGDQLFKYVNSIKNLNNFLDNCLYGCPNFDEGFVTFDASHRGIRYLISQEKTYLYSPIFKVNITLYDGKMCSSFLQQLLIGLH